MNGGGSINPGTKKYYDNGDLYYNPNDKSRNGGSGGVVSSIKYLIMFLIPAGLLIWCIVATVCVGCGNPGSGCEGCCPDGFGSTMAGELSTGQDSAGSTFGSG